MSGFALLVVGLRRVGLAGARPCAALARGRSRPNGGEQQNEIRAAKRATSRASFICAWESRRGRRRRAEAARAVVRAARCVARSVARRGGLPFAAAAALAAAARAAGSVATSPSRLRSAAGSSSRCSGWASRPSPDAGCGAPSGAGDRTAQARGARDRRRRVGLRERGRRGSRDDQGIG